MRQYADGIRLTNDILHKARRRVVAGPATTNTAPDGRPATTLTVAAHVDAAMAETADMTECVVVRFNAPVVTFHHEVWLDPTSGSDHRKTIVETPPKPMTETWGTRPRFRGG